MLPQSAAQSGASDARQDCEHGPTGGLTLPAAMRTLDFVKRFRRKTDEKGMSVSRDRLRTGTANPQLPPQL